MAPLIGFLIQALLPVAVSEVKKKLAKDESTPYVEAKEVPTHIAAPIAAIAAAKGIATSKTAWFAGALLVLGFLEQNQQLLTQVIPAQWMGAFISGVGFITLILRTITTDSVVDGPKKED